VAYDRGINDEASLLRVLSHGALESRFITVCLHHRRLHVVDDDSLRHTSEKLPRLFQSINDYV